MDSLDVAELFSYCPEEAVEYQQTRNAELCLRREWEPTIACQSLLRRDLTNIAPEHIREPFYETRRAFPNPARGGCHFHCQHTRRQLLLLRLFNLMGRTVADVLYSYRSGRI